MAAISSLKTMADSKEFASVKNVQTYFAIDPRTIVVQEGFNARPIDNDHVESIKLAYNSGSLIPPLFVRLEKGKTVLVDGHHRLAAYLELIQEGVEIKSVEVREFKGNNADRIVLMLNSAQGKPLTPLQSALQFSKLINFGWTIQEIADKVGKSYQHVYQLLQLTEADAEVQKMIEEGSVSTHIAIKTMKEHGSDAGNVLKAEVKKAKADGKKKVTAKSMGSYTLVQAIKMEMESEGAVRAEDLCPQYIAEIQYLRHSLKADAEFLMDIQSETLDLHAH